MPGFEGPTLGGWSVHYLLGSLEEVVGVEEFASVQRPASPPRISRATKLGFPSRSVLVACAGSGVARQTHGGLELKNSAH